MKKIKQALSLAVAMALAAAPLVASAQTTSPPAPANNGFDMTKIQSAAKGLTNTTIFALISTFMNWLLGIIGVLAVIAFVVSGILYITAAGDEDRIKTAKETMMYAILGLVIALIGLIIVNAVAGLTGGGGATAY